MKEELRSAQEAAEAAAAARASAEAAADRHRRDLSAAAEQLACARQGQATAAQQAGQLQEQVEEMEGRAALYIAKEAHYDDLKAEHDEACQLLEQSRDDLAAARAEARSMADQVRRLQTTTATAAARLPPIRSVQVSIRQ
jgi:chromosome segregation ATPase